MVCQNYTVYLQLGPGTLLVSSSSVCHSMTHDCRNVGLLRYWTLSNLPLFGLAIPTAYVMINSAVVESAFLADNTSKRRSQLPLTRRFALPQILVAVLAFTNYHVQIITRLSSGYPLWYIWIAERIIISSPRMDNLTTIIITWMIMYSTIQAGLFACFLPPA